MKAARKAPAQGVEATGGTSLDRFIDRLSRILGIPDMALPENRQAAKWGLGFALVAMLLRIVFWIYTQRYWEDSLITCLHSENFWLGNGLTHVRPGEPPLHGFTSPLSVLVPLIGDAFHVGFGLEFIKLVTIPAAAATVLYTLGICISPALRFPLPLAVAAAGYMAVEHQQILFGMAGMETQLATLAVMASLYHTIAWQPRQLGVWLGICMLARPDFAFWCAIIGCYGLYREWRRMPLIVGLALAVYLPWIVFTIRYYHSPIPNTMVAKSLGYHMWYDNQPVMSAPVVLSGIWMMLSQVLHICLGPTFKGHGTNNVVLWGMGQQSWIANIMFLFVLGGLATIFRRRLFVLWPLAVGAVIYGLYYIFLVPIVMGWYVASYVPLLLLLALFGVHVASGYIAREQLRARVLWGFAGVYLFLFVSVLPYTFYAEHQIQTYVENGVRMQAGLFLRDRMKPDQAVGCEPLGYMGYYSRGNVYDWPGLDSRRVVEWSSSVPHTERCLENMLKGLEPEYLYLREGEFAGNFKDRNWFTQRYHPVKQFRVAPEDMKKIPMVSASADTNFWIYQKNHPGASSP